MSNRTIICVPSCRSSELVNSVRREAPSWRRDRVENRRHLDGHCGIDGHQRRIFERNPAVSVALRLEGAPPERDEAGDAQWVQVRMVHSGLRSVEQLEVT